MGEARRERLAKVKNIESQINKNTGRTNTAMQMMLDGEIDAAEYRQIKSSYDEANTTLLKQRASPRNRQR
ncbi:MAG TPA: hypothetical protein VJ184_00620 [Chryseolinea sp.]|nr:hypothetical protein [Chryseolinea sp.]